MGVLCREYYSREQRSEMIPMVLFAALPHAFPRFPTRRLFPSLLPIKFLVGCGVRDN